MCSRALRTQPKWGTRTVGKVYNPCRVKTDRSAMLTIKSGLDPHMIIELEDGIEIVGYLWFEGIIL
jgi:hypothetical protein